MELTDEKWACIAPLFPKRGRGRGRPPRAPREIVEALLWILWTGAPWRALPKKYPPYQTCHKRFQRWCADGTLKRVVKALAGRIAGGGTEAFIDGTYVAAQRGGDCVGRCRAGNATKVMAIADSAGLPIALHIAAGSRHDVALVGETLSELVVPAPQNLIGDRGFDSTKLAIELQANGIELIAPKRSNNQRRRQDGRRLRRAKRRWKVERLFAWLKQFRRIIVRWENKALNYLGFLYLGGLVILLRHR